MSEVVQEAKTLYDAFEVIYPSREDANSPYQILVPPEVYSGSMRFYHLSPELRICLLQKTNTINSKHGFILIFFSHLTSTSQLHQKTHQRGPVQTHALHHRHHPLPGKELLLMSSMKPARLPRELNLVHLTATN